MKPFSTCLMIVAAAAVLASCAPAPRPAPIQPIAPIGIDPLTGLPVDVTPGLNDREPDTCKAADYRQLIGQPESSVAASGIMRPTRIVPVNGIVSQVEYDSFRMNFYLDANGNVARINCG